MKSVQPGAIGVRYSRSKSYRSLNPHIHCHYEMLFVVDGVLSVENSADKITVEAPAIIIHNILTFHGVNTLRDGYTRFIVNFSDTTLKLCPQFTDKISFFRSSNMSVIKLDPQMFDIMRMYFSRYNVIGRDLDMRAYLTLTILYELSVYQTESSNITSYSCRKPYINDLLGYISENYSDPISLDSLAQKYYISRAKLVQDFKLSTGMTVNDYLTTIRLNNAKYMLGSGMSVQETAKNCGYDSTSYFVTLFKKNLGVSPGKFESYYKIKAKEYFDGITDMDEGVYFYLQ